MNKQYIIIDLEMNPVSKVHKVIKKQLRREIIEIGAVRLNEQLEVVDKFRCLVKPIYNRKIAPYITKLTGISLDDVVNSDPLDVVLLKLIDWIGEDEAVKIYSWSNTDNCQLKNECALKGIEVPHCFNDWIDFQALYYQSMGKDICKEQMSLKAAAQQFGIVMDEHNTHSALYDATITAKLVIALLDGSYQKQANLIRTTLCKEDQLTFSIGEACGDIFQQLLDRIQQNELKSEDI